MTEDLKNKIIDGVIIIGFAILVTICWKACKNTPIKTNGNSSHTRDTVYSIDTITIKGKDTFTRGKDHWHYDSIPIHDTVWASWCTVERIYKDSMSNEDITIYTVDSVVGKKLASSISYNLHIKKEIKTATIYDSVRIEVPAYKSALFLTGEIGGNKNTFNAGLGLTYIHKKGWGVGYQFEAIQKTHNITVHKKIL